MGWSTPLGQALSSLSGSSWLCRLGKKGREQADGRQEGADMIDEIDRGHVGEPAEKSGADASNAEGKPEK